MMRIVRNIHFPHQTLQPLFIKLLLGVIMSKLIHLIFNYRLGLVGLELTQNICEGRGCRVNILTKKRSKDLSK